MENEEYRLPLCGKRFFLNKPLAGERNRAMIASETAAEIDGKLVTIMKQSELMYLLLPKCVKFPDDDVPVNQLLDSLDILLHRVLFPNQG